jgi:hypothetical protein
LHSCVALLGRGTVPMELKHITTLSGKKVEHLDFLNNDVQMAKTRSSNNYNNQPDRRFPMTRLTFIRIIIPVSETTVKTKMLNDGQW